MADGPSLDKFNATLVAFQGPPPLTCYGHKVARSIEPLVHQIHCNCEPENIAPKDLKTLPLRT